MITIDDYFTNSGKVPDRRIAYAKDFTPAILAKAVETVARANLVLGEFGQDRAVNSGWRPPAVNAATAGAAEFSRHMTGEAIDIYDPEGDLDQWFMDFPQKLQEFNVYMEHPATTKGWCHLQLISPHSGRRIFFP